METYNISKLGRFIGMSPDTIRYYEKLGLIEKPSRQSNNYRFYSKDSAIRLLFIKRSKTMGFTLKEIKELLNIKRASLNTCKNVQAQVECKLKDIEKKIDDLRKLKKALKEVVLTCKESVGNECPVLNLLEQHKTNKN